MRIDYDRSFEVYQRVQLKLKNDMQEEKLIRADILRTF